MILINVFFQQMNQEYDFKVNEESVTGQVAEELAGLIAQKEHMTVSKDETSFILCDKEQKKILNPYDTLLDNGVQSGSTLWLM